jgi:hypothetical protein
MTITLTPQEAESHFYNALCNGLGYISDYGLELTYDDADYATAKQNILQNKTAADISTVCYEDVLLQILRDGKTLTLIDNEGGEDPAEITILHVHERVEKTPIRHLMNAITENDDAETADVILQTVFLNDIVYG